MCGSCSGRGTGRVNLSSYQRIPIVPQEDCDLEKSVLENYLSSIQNLYNEKRSSDIGLTDVAMRSYIGILQSALNYPDNYCYYSAKINQFIDNVLPRIILL